MWYAGTLKTNHWYEWDKVVDQGCIFEGQRRKLFYSLMTTPLHMLFIPFVLISNFQTKSMHYLWYHDGKVFAVGSLDTYERPSYSGWPIDFPLEVNVRVFSVVMHIVTPLPCQPPVRLESSSHTRLPRATPQVGPWIIACIPRYALMAPCQYRDDLSRYVISIIKIRRSWDDLIFVMGILYSPWWWIYFRNHKDIFAFCLISQHGKGTISWICVLLRVNILLFYPCPSGLLYMATTVSM